MLETIPVIQTPLSVPEYQKLKAALVRGKRTDTRNILILRMLFATGLRISELLRLTPSMILQEGPDTSIYIYRGKKEKQAWELLPLEPTVGADLVSFIRGNQIKPGELVFRLSRVSVYLILKDAGNRSLGKPISPKQLRQLYIKAQLERGVSIEAVAKMVGHVDIRTTMAHYYNLTKEQRQEINRGLPV